MQLGAHIYMAGANPGPQSRSYTHSSGFGQPRPSYDIPGKGVVHRMHLMLLGNPIPTAVILTVLPTTIHKVKGSES